MFATDSGFEDEVRRIARLLWPRAEFGGAEMSDGRERDGIFETDEFAHLVECTVSRSKQKAVEDFEKLSKLIRQTEVRVPQKFCKGWFVTLNEPTADQRSVFARAKSRISPFLSTSSARELIDARGYLQLRSAYPFGSVRDPATGAPQTELRYVPLDIADKAGAILSVSSVAERVAHGERLILVGDYGAGKSSTLSQYIANSHANFGNRSVCAFL